MIFQEAIKIRAISELTKAFSQKNISRSEFKGKLKPTQVNSKPKDLDEILQEKKFIKDRKKVITINKDSIIGPNGS